MLRDCPKVLPALLSWNVKGSPRLTETISGPIRFGNMTLRAEKEPVKTVVWGVYCSGAETDVTIRGPVRICELMVFDGHVRLFGTEGTHDAVCLSTTLDAHNNTHVELENVRLRRPLAWTGAKRSSIVGQVSAQDDARFVGRNVSLGRLRMITRDNATITLENAVKTDEVSREARGGPIRLLPPGAPSKPEA